MNPTECVVDAMGGVKFGSAVTFQNLTMVPILTEAERGADYLTLDEALAAGLAEVTEVSEAAQVSRLKIVVKGHQPVLIVDGEELVGAKQNRVLNLTVLVPAGRETELPVSCVEAGRWRHVSRRFSSAPRTQFAEGRAARMQQVSVAMSRSGSHASDQGAVWDLIERKATRLRASSDTAAMSAMYEQLDTPIEAFVSALAGPAAGDRYAGAVFFVNGRPAGLELFDVPATWRKLSPKIIRSYALDAIDAHAMDRAQPNPGGEARVSEADSIRACTEFAARVASSTAAEFPAVGEGDDVRFGGGAVVGGALVARGGVVHVSAFPDVQG